LMEISIRVESFLLHGSSLQWTYLILRLKKALLKVKGRPA
jgi:hypothetical protein